MTQIKLAPAPEMLIGPEGKPRFGNFAGPIRTLNLDDFDYRSLRRPPWTWNRDLARQLLKRWQFVGVVDEHFVFGAAVVHVNYLGTGFTYLYDRRNKTIVHEEIKTPLAARTRFSPTAVNGVSEIRQGAKSIFMDNTVRDGRREAAVDFGDKLSAKVAYRENGTGVTSVIRQSLYGFNHTYKAAGLPALGSLKVNGQEYQFSDQALALIDWTVGTPPRETIWNWAAAMGRDKKGRILGLNFGSGLNEYGFTENTVWLDGKPFMFAGISFEYDSFDIMTPWRLFSTFDDAVDLNFHPEHERFEQIYAGIASSRLHQPFGSFNGRLALASEKLNVELYGFCEEHYAKW